MILLYSSFVPLNHFFFPNPWKDRDEGPKKQMEASWGLKKVGKKGKKKKSFDFLRVAFFMHFVTEESGGVPSIYCPEMTLYVSSSTLYDALHLLLRRNWCRVSGLGRNAWFPFTFCPSLKGLMMGITFLWLYSFGLSNLCFVLRIRHKNQEGLDTRETQCLWRTSASNAVVPYNSLTL